VTNAFARGNAVVTEGALLWFTIDASRELSAELDLTSVPVAVG
jgi:hypothetical protein